MDVRQISLIEEQARRFRDLQSKRSAGTLTEEEHAEWRELLEHYAPTLLSAGKAREEISLLLSQAGLTAPSRRQLEERLRVLDLLQGTA